MHATTKACTCYKISLGMHMEKTLWNQKLYTNVAKARIHYICTWQTSIMIWNQHVTISLHKLKETIKCYKKLGLPYYHGKGD
jgi:hypothetical protein